MSCIPYNVEEYVFILFIISNLLLQNNIQKMSRYWQESRVSPLNKSVSKFGYAFDRTPRFRSTSKALCDSFYDISTNISSNKKGSGIGRGSKVSFGDKNGYPSPSLYNIKSEFSNKQKGYGIRLGRENLKYGGIFQKSQSPDPARYTISQSSSRSSKKGYTMRSKIKALQPSYKKAPGPGQYKISSTIEATGIYCLSNMTNCPGPKIKPSKPYNPQLKQKVPSPAQYNLEKQNLNQKGLYFNSRYQASKSRSFSRSRRDQDTVLKMKKKLPGPGAYNYFSQFGAKQNILGRP